MPPISPALESPADPVAQPTAAERMHHDPRVAQAKALLQSALDEARSTLTNPRPPIVERRADYERTLADFAQHRGGNLFYPYLGSGLGRGPLVELDDGSVKYDMITGIGVHFFGHSHPELTDAVLDAGLADTVMAGNLQQNRDSAELVEAILKLANRDQLENEHTEGGASGRRFAHCFLTSSGAMANENALKLAFHRKPASRVLAFEKCFCGRTMVMSQITDKAAYRVGLPKTIDVDYVPGFDAEDAEGSTRRALAVLDQHLARYPGQHAAMKFELIVGEGGFYPGSTAFFRTLMQRLKDHDVAVMADEIQTFARTPAPFAFQHFGLDDLVDLVTIGKASQVCATLFTAAFKPKPGLLSQTFTSSATAIAAARWTIDQLAKGDLYGPDGRLVQVHTRFIEHFKAIHAEHPDWIDGPFGLGGMIACTPFGGDPAKVRALLHRLFDLGVIAFLAGGAPARLRFLPPVPVTSDDDIDAVCDLLRQAMADVAHTEQQP